MNVQWLVDGWVSYVQTLIPRGATQMQVQETRRAFYAGLKYYHGVLATLDAEAKPGERDRILQEIERELERFAKFVGTAEECMANAFEVDMCGIAAGEHHGKH